MKSVLVSIALIVITVVQGCKDNGASISSALDKVDARLIGEWYYLDTLMVQYPSPSLAFNGIQFVQGDTVKNLGIHTASGRVALMEESFPKRLLHASNGILIWQYFATRGIFVDTMRYVAQSNLLVLTGKYTSTTYHRTELGSAIVSPLQSVLRVAIDSQVVQNQNVAAFPSAFVSRQNSTALQLHAFIPNGLVTIDVDGFQGVGTYAIGSNKGMYTQWLGDVSLILRTDSLTPGTIVISEYDEAARHCTGSFEFTAKLRMLPNDPMIIRRLENGGFSVPVYF